jgi:hypothetical protein
MFPQKFPAYLAFGKLNEASIQQNNKVASATYEFQGIRILELTLWKSNCQIKEYFGDELAATTQAPTLLQCFRLHYSEHPGLLTTRAHLLAETVCKLGNIYFEFPQIRRGDAAPLPYPAGLNFVIRLPITQDALHIINPFMGHALPYTEVHRFYPTLLHICYNRYPGRCTKFIYIVELLTPAALLLDKVQLLLSKNLIAPEKHLRAIIQEAGQLYSSGTKLFIGQKGDSYHWYELELQEL